MASLFAHLKESAKHNAYSTLMLTGDTRDHGLPPIVHRTHNGWGMEILFTLELKTL
jgi:hypothetical protein